MEVLPCSRIAHIERAHKPYTENLTAHVRRNALRVAEVWMDQHKNHVYMAWNVPLQVRKHEARARALCGWVCVHECVHSHGLLFVFWVRVTDLLATMSRAWMQERFYFGKLEIGF